ncbi:MAG: Na/Pi cotransporter family protein [Gammaproteobacteria bacterium]|uniref:Na/Pi cotransporter family protein n=1 Tax=Rhodoferax sp. TaxID=50421 RepID=UPI00185B1B5F|nr:Na/Pi cotransporter family protein [Rhodoferax sp.]MBU3898253.1 Na/Pi cotransporter family protein [Gammaproteobacteria bacterium]MBA3059048.1 Na/Pi cotransporter family protein [Rhodoferax sp.]MBU3997003.1 Na/Pi cotransporter family protein [Gammaproteobacteria bacterium]MBU4081438.1 Na/Pi cotransporter family protein [Gammaproteobacteria bacterium]MBU4114217.1 Na/Pi cotransporter family protein [Gammaproteobacteria bacterium]
MSLWALASSLAGGLGLFLLGMTMMTDGLKLAAGPALERILAGATRTRWHALGSGVMVTALVQSSSAVTVAAIGFVNAGLLSLGPALWVLFGANVGTTMTGWIVAMIGLKFKIEALALPLIGVGVVMRLTGQGQRRGAIGSALAGFGLLFFGIAMLQQAFTGLADQVSLPQGEGALAVLGQVSVGALMTVLMQSSSASIAIALTAAQGGLLSTQGAAAVVIGANIGTTVTAMFAAIGATPNARRAAAAHVVFNLITGVVALALLPWLIDALGVARAALGLPSDPAAKLALFHTIFNVLGVLLMWPLAAPLTRWLQARFRAREDDEAQPQFLDDNVLQVPSLAVDALTREVARIGRVTLRMARAALTGAEPPALARDRAVLMQLNAAVEAFVERMNRSAMSQRASERLAQVLRVLRYHETVTEQVRVAAPLRPLVAAGPTLTLQHNAFVQHTAALLTLCDPQVPEPGAAALDAASQEMESAYEALKSALLAAGAAGGARLSSMEEALRRYSALRRAAQQATKARRRWPTAAPPDESR